VARLTRDVLVGPSFALTLLPRLALVLSAVLLVAGALFVLVERPCMRPGWPRELLAWWAARRAHAKGAAT
jgi:peptidoglycan/LPS O-acetylase OafA/YrhL